jgi:hypothetical protein
MYSNSGFFFPFMIFSIISLSVSLVLIPKLKDDSEYNNINKYSARKNY